MGRLFNVQKAAISRHVKNIFDSGELNRKATVSILETVQTEGVRTIQRRIEYYNLDLILSIGYRVNSASATKFRQWATKILRRHILEGYTINRKRIGANYDAFLKSVADIHALLPAGAVFDVKAVLDLVREFASTWVSLDAYDKGKLKVSGVTKRNVSMTARNLSAAIGNLKDALTQKGEASNFFAQEREKGSVEGVVGNIMQAFDGKPLYPTIEEKAAHLLYFIAKGHLFIDGNKRSGAFAFLWFLKKAHVKGGRNINPSALTALTLLVAESDPKKKEQVVALITQLLK